MSRYSNRKKGFSGSVLDLPVLYLYSLHGIKYKLLSKRMLEIDSVALCSKSVSVLEWIGFCNMNKSRAVYPPSFITDPDTNSNPSFFHKVVTDPA